jgi:Ser/Thr protein kinase RdoA (MazF antagonist)
LTGIDFGESIMDRQSLIEAHEKNLIERAVELYKLNAGDITAFESYEGCRNLVYACRLDTREVILRFSYRQDRTPGQIQAELHFINYLVVNGVRAAKPIPSINGKLLESFLIDELPIYLVCFEKGAGMRVPDNGYRYREGVPLEEYYQNWGRVLGQMHRLSRSYQPLNPDNRRPDWFEIHADKLAIDAVIPHELSLVRDRIHALLDKIRALSKDNQCYGLIHGDFNDGNFTVDYNNGDITIFDFDDSCYFFHAYELAAAWEGGIGRTMFAGLEARKAFMDHYMENVLAGYARENKVSDGLLARIPLFIKLIQVEEFLHFAPYIGHTTDEEIDGHLNYLVACIEGDIPYMGFFDPIFLPETPFNQKPI